MKRIASLVICMALYGSGGATAQSPAVPPGDWMTFNRTLAGDRFSPLSEINHDNVARLRPVCTYTLPEVVSLQTGPLVIDGTMYFTSESSSYAIDASNCVEKWRTGAHGCHNPLGTTFAAGDLIVELETHKAVVEARAGQPGVLREIKAAPGDWCEIGTPLALFSDSVDEVLPDVSVTASDLMIAFDVI